MSMNEPLNTSDQAVAVPRSVLERLIAMADSYWEDVSTGLADGTYERSQNLTHVADGTVIEVATQLASARITTPSSALGHLDARVVVVVKDGEVAQVLADKPGVNIAVVEYGPQAEEELVLIPYGSGKFSKGWAGVCDADLAPARAAELYALAESASIRGVVKEGLYSGQVVTVNAGVVTQKVDREGNTVKHLADNLTQSLKPGAVVDIRYANGVGIVHGLAVANEQGR